MPDAPTPVDRLYVALDVERLDDAEALLDRLTGIVGGCKIGSQLFTAAGPVAIERARKRGFRVFLDLKYHDIPNTVAGAVREATRLGVVMLNVHAGGGLAMMRAASESAAKAAKEFALPRPLVLGVTVLTSLDRRALEQEVGVLGPVEAHVVRLAERAREAGLDGCVASAREIAPLRLALGRRWVIVTPGIRPAARGDDQRRTGAPGATVRAGADYLVVGRPITAEADPAAAARSIVEDIRAALA
ncbi:MAG TPA: orotidine-5'-phosphate decarboxylase [Methylomirabilota bacterium]|jgi:orotidine-5'-phosphate decarboxylase|nr:orotidine-5'-phosphate decarboxylase [Methylomirabilota bacterium]